MQDAGGLRKRRKRNLRKVDGLGLVAYTVENDKFDINELFQTPPQHNFVTPIPNASNSSARLTSRSSSCLSSFDAESARSPSTNWSSASIHEDDETASREQQYRYIDERPVLLSNGVLLRLKSVLLLGICTFCYPWKWNGKTYQIEKWSEKNQKIWKMVYSFFLALTCISTVFQFYSFFRRVQVDEEGGHRPIFMNAFSILKCTYTLSLNSCLLFYREQKRIYINTMLSTNRVLTEKYVVDLHFHKVGGGAFLNVSVWTNISQVAIYVSNFLVTPFAPWYLYSYIYTETNPWYWLLPGAFQEFVSGGQVIAIQMLLGWVNVAHCISVEFWLQESHKNYDSPCTKAEMRESKNAMETYRYLQLLNVMFNKSMAPLCIPVCKFIDWTATVSCFYVLIRSMNQKFLDEFPGILTYPLSVLDCTTFSYGTQQISSEMQGMSESCLTSWSATAHMDFRRVLVSYPTLKVKVANVYHISVSTTFTYFRTIIEYIVNLIVTFK